MRGELTEMLSVKVSKREVRIIEACAKAEGMTVSAFLRSSALVAAVMGGNVDAMKLCAGIAAAKLKAFASANLDEIGERVSV